MVDIPWAKPEKPVPAFELCASMSPNNCENMSTSNGTSPGESSLAFAQRGDRSDIGIPLVVGVAGGALFLSVGTDDDAAEDVVALASATNGDAEVDSAWPSWAKPVNPVVLAEGTDDIDDDETSVPRL